MEAMKRLDRLLIAAVLVLAAAAAADALRGRGSHGRPTAAEPRSEMSRGEAPVPERIRLVPSDTAYLPACAAPALRLSVGPGPQLALRYAGPPCHVAPLHLRAIVRGAGGRVVYRGPAMAREELSGNFAGRGETHGRLLVGCRSAQLMATVRGSGLRARGSIRCRGRS
jgi:hypothetical protein